MVLTRCCTPPLFSILQQTVIARPSHPTQTLVYGLLRERFSKNLTYLPTLPTYLRLDPEICCLGAPHRLLQKKNPLLHTSFQTWVWFSSPKALCVSWASEERRRQEETGTSWPRKPDGKRPPVLAADQTRSEALASPGPHSGRNPIPRDSHREVPFGVLPYLRASSNQLAAEQQKESLRSAPAEEARHLTPPTHRHTD